jgi:glycosyltransferase involved in cell wall biosynthesis
MNFWTISLFDPTPYDKVGDLRFIQIAKAANRAGHRVTHFTSTFRHSSKGHRFDRSTTFEENPNYNIEYIHSNGYRKNISLERVRAHADFAEKLMDDLKRRPKPDAIFISMPPLSSAEAVTEWASTEGIPVFVDIIDPWPDSFIKDVPLFLKPLSRLAIRPYYKKLERILKNSTVVTSISNGYLSWAKSRCDGIRQTACFYPALDLDEILVKMQKLSETETRNEEVLRMVYVGSLGSSYDIPAIVKAAAVLNEKHSGKTEFIIAGAGPQAEIAIEYEKKHPNLKYLGRISDEELMRQYYLSDLGLLQHKNNLTQTVTYKLFSYLSAGLPILNSLQSEMVDIIESNSVGMNNMNGDVDALVANIESFLFDREKLGRYKKNAIELTREKGDSTKVYSGLINMLESAAAEMPTSMVQDEK